MTFAGSETQAAPLNVPVGFQGPPLNVYLFLDLWSSA